jgi:hypothetical protein
VNVEQEVPHEFPQEVVEQLVVEQLTVQPVPVPQLMTVPQLAVPQPIPTVPQPLPPQEGAQSSTVLSPPSPPLPSPAKGLIPQLDAAIATPTDERPRRTERRLVCMRRDPPSPRVASNRARPGRVRM